MSGFTGNVWELKWKKPSNIYWKRQPARAALQIINADSSDLFNLDGLLADVYEALGPKVSLWDLLLLVDGDLAQLTDEEKREFEEGFRELINLGLVIQL